MKKLLSVILFATLFISTYSQEQCASMYMDSLRRAQQGTESLQDFENWLQTLIAKNPKNISYKGGRAVVTIPFIVHVIHNGDNVGSGENISQAQINSQIDVLNEDFRKEFGTAGYNTNPVGADVEIEWCPALIDPNGNILPEPGIDRVNLGTASYSSTTTIDNSVKPQTYWDPDRYCNIWVVNMTGSILGYAQFPNVNLQGIGTNNGGASTDGVVIRHTAFGRVGNVTSPYNKGRTLTHELGHWLGLRHIWGDGSSCSATDYCDDTPKAIEANRGCPTINSCNDGTPDPNDMVQNYMDYTNDGCMNIFTECQKTRMTTALNNAPRRATLLNSNVCTIPVFFSYTGRVVDASTNQGVANALVFLDGKADYLDTTDANGNFSLNNMQEGVYTIYAGKWGYVTGSVNNITLQQGSPQTTVLINPGYYDDFLLNFNWTESGTASSGKWVRGVPVGASFTQNNTTYMSNPDVDVAGDYGNISYVTGNGGGQAGTDDVDNGTTTLTSPVFDITSYTEPILSYYRWFYNGGGNGPTPNDSLVVSVTNGNQTVILEKTTYNSAALSQWLFRTYRLKDYITITNNMRLLVTTADDVNTTNGHLVDGGFDLFRIKDSTATANVPPIVNFSASKTTVCAGETVSFSNLSLNDPDTLSWSFPGGNINSSNISQPQVTYNIPGVYSVSLIGTNEAGSDTTEFTNFVTVNAVEAEFESNVQSICTGMQIQFTQTSFCNADSFEWVFDGGLPASSTSPTPLVTYNAAGFYDVKLIAKNSIGADTIVKNLFAQVLVPPTVDVTTTDNINFAIQGTATATVTGGIGPYTYIWDDAGNQTTQTITGLSPGIYSVTITDVNGCTTVGFDTVNFVQNTLVEDIAGNFKATVAPNPFNNKFELNVQTGKEVFAILSNQVGQVVVERSVINGKKVFDLSDLPVGIYYLQLHTADKQYAVKLMKQ